MRKQQVEERIKNFSEVALGYNIEEAIAEAKRCLQCKKQPCVQGCPVHIDIPSFIKKIVEGDFSGALEKIREKNLLPGICGRVCPQEDQCQKTCILAKKGRPIAIGALERFVADEEKNSGGYQKWISACAGMTEKWAGVTEHTQDTERRLKPAATPSTGRQAKVAIVGSGPAGLTLAGDLIKAGIKVTIFEGLHQPGGVLVYGIPEFRLPKKIVNQEINNLVKFGVELKLDTVIGKTIFIQDLLQDYDIIYIAVGAGSPKFLNIEGENLNGVYSANEFLTRINLMKAYLFPQYLTPIKRLKKIAVIGGGNVAIDAARCALRLGAEKVYCIYRRTENEMPAREDEIENAFEEGIEFIFLSAPLRIIGDENGWVKEIECIKMKLAEPDESGRRRPIPLNGSNFKISIDEVVVAIGTKANPLLTSSTELIKTNSHGYIETGENGITTHPRIYAGGDIVTGSATVISAMGMARQSAQDIIKKIGRSKNYGKS